MRQPAHLDRGAGGTVVAAVRHAGIDILDGGSGDDSINNVGLGDTVEGGSGHDWLAFDLSNTTSGQTINILTGQGAGASWTGVENIAGMLGFLALGLGPLALLFRRRRQTRQD